MGVPLKDGKKKIRYWLHAFVDVTCLLTNSHQLDSFHGIVETRQGRGRNPDAAKASLSHPQIEFDKLVNSLDPDELRRLVALGRRKALLAEGVFFKNETSRSGAEPNTRDSSLSRKQRRELIPMQLFYHNVSTRLGRLARII